MWYVGYNRINKKVVIVSNKLYCYNKFDRASLGGLNITCDASTIYCCSGDLNNFLYVHSQWLLD